MWVFRQAIRNFIGDEKAAFAPAMAIMFTVLMGAGALGVDVGEWLRQKHAMQTATDAAALAGGYALANYMSDSVAQTDATNAAETNGYDSTATSANFNFSVNDDGDGAGDPSVTVTLTQPVHSWFVSLITNKSFTTVTTATAQVEANDGVYCMLSLGSAAPYGIKASGNVTIDANGCGLAVDSDSSTALYLNGNVTVNVGDVSIVGQDDTVGSVTFDYSSLRTNSAQVADPYYDLSVQGESPTCTLAQQQAGPTQYNGQSGGTFCGGISFSGNTTLQPGTYYIDGGDFSLSGQTQVTGNGVTLVFTNSAGAGGTYGHMNVTGGGGVDITAPTSGYYEGVAVYQDRNTPSSGCVDNFTGNSAVIFNGVFYAPTCEVDYGGTSSASTTGVCTKIIADTIVFHGTPSIGSSCTSTSSGGSTRAIGGAAVVLIE